MTTRHHGYSLVELLAATALFGIIAIGCGALMQEVTREAKRAELTEDAFEATHGAALRLRVAAASAASARREGDVLALTTRDGVTSRWRACDGTLLRDREPRDATTCDPSALRVEQRAMGTIVIFRTAAGEGRVLVGGAP